MTDPHRDWALITLTENGQRLAQRIVADFPVVINHLHKPTAFASTLQALFNEGVGLICVCATGIVVRALAPVLNDKHLDPPVLVLDERGEHVIPLLSGHEGHANLWATRLAGLLAAQCVRTTANSYSRIDFVAGMGCVRDCSKDILLELLRSQLHRIQLEISGLQAVTSISQKADEQGLIALAQDLAVPFITYSAPQLRQVEAQLSTRSERVYAEMGCYGVAEAAALLHARQLGDGPARLLTAKIKNQHATLALAEPVPVVC